MTELICIACPTGCHLKIDEQNGFAVSGNKCQKGEEYGKKELINPTRILTSTVRISGGEIPRLPVKTSSDIPKGKIKSAMALLNSVTMTAPIEIGAVVLENILGLSVDFVATKSISAKNQI